MTNVLNVNPCHDMGGGVKWNWKSGEIWNDFTTNIPFNRNYFDCGVYYFDGVFNVVKFPADMSLYHGSGMLADNVVEFPAGIKYYEKYNLDNPESSITVDVEELLSIVVTTDESVEEAITKYLPITAGWYADPSTSKLYSNKSSNLKLNSICNDRCISAYKLKKDITMLILDDDYNIAKLLASNDKLVPIEIKNLLKAMFSIKNTFANRTNSDNPFVRLHYEKDRFSNIQWDIPFSKWLCEYVIKVQNYSGYAATTQQSKTHGGSFHLEFVFCDAFKYLERDLTNVLDWQHNNISYPDMLKSYMQQLSLYKCTNINFHSGNLLEHSIWSLLFSEFNIKYNTVQIPKFNTDNFTIEEIKNLTIFTSFIHDIGKMSYSECKFHNGSFYYKDIQTHNVLGYEYILGKKEIPIFDSKMNITGNLNIKDIFEVFKINYDKFKDIIALVILLHQFYGKVALNKFNKTDDTNSDEIILEFIKMIINDYYTKYLSSNDLLNPNNKDTLLLFFYILLVTSISDIEASQPYGINRISNMDSIPLELNKRSEYFPFITNMPKKYRGGNIINITKIDTNGVILANKMLNYIMINVN